MIQKAQKLFNEGQYADAFRLLFDAMYQEYQLFPEKPSPNALEERIHLITSLVQQDQSPLMQLFRDLNVPLEEKLTYLTDLRRFVAHEEQLDEKELFQGEHGGTLVQLLKSAKLDQGEKFDVLHWIEGAIQSEYTPMTQWERIREEITHLQELSEQKLREHRYVEAFVLINEAKQKADDIDLLQLSHKEDLALSKQAFHMIEVFVQEDESPLMKRLKNRLVSYRKKKQLLMELEWQFKKNSLHMPKKVFFQGKEYDGTLVQILSHPKIAGSTKYMILIHLKKLIKKYLLMP